MNYFENSVLVWNRCNAGTTMYDVGSFEKREAAARIIFDEFCCSEEANYLTPKFITSESLSEMNQMIISMTDEETGGYPEHVKREILRAKERIKKNQKHVSEQDDRIERYNRAVSLYTNFSEDEFVVYKSTVRKSYQSVEDFEKLFEKVSIHNPHATLTSINFENQQWIEEPWNNFLLINELQECKILKTLGTFNIIKFVDPEKIFKKIS